MSKAIGMLEIKSIAKGIYAADAMVKASDIELYTASPTCPGKYEIVVLGDVAEVETAIQKGIEIAESFLIDSTLIPNINEEVFFAMKKKGLADEIKALGILEVRTLAAMIEAADRVLKAADLHALSLRLGGGIGGKAYFVFTGDISAVSAGLEAGRAIAEKRGAFVDGETIASPAFQLKQIFG